MKEIELQDLKKKYDDGTKGVKSVESLIEEANKQYEKEQIEGLKAINAIECYFANNILISNLKDIIKYSLYKKLFKFT